jgi:hypothetical protein
MHSCRRSSASAVSVAIARVQSDLACAFGVPPRSHREDPQASTARGSAEGRQGSAIVAVAGSCSVADRACERGISPSAADRAPGLTLPRVADKARVRRRAEQP